MASKLIGCVIAGILALTLIVGPNIQVQAWGVTTHPWIVEKSIANLPAGPWQNAFEFYIDKVKLGASIPDVWMDWYNHWYNPITQEGGAPDAIEHWYGNMRGNFSMNALEDGMFAAGVMIHYYSDINMPAHTGDGWPGHITVETDINNHLEIFEISVGAPKVNSDPRQEAIKAATFAQPFYDECIAAYPTAIAPLPSPLDADPNFRDMITTQLERAIVGVSSLWLTATQGLGAPLIPIDSSVRFIIIVSVLLIIASLSLWYYMYRRQHSKIKWY
jgi:hypothetical protein